MENNDEEPFASRCVSSSLQQGTQDSILLLSSICISASRSSKESESYRRLSYQHVSEFQNFFAEFHICFFRRRRFFPGTEVFLHRGYPENAAKIESSKSEANHEKFGQE